ncbi:GNAT family N-acetyltransferase [Streptomyces beijiangensis]|uniref:GNAT family N-acetyltransferase n=1 Tax=Streptomyces beijiangensis TaxID=163361 RepID=A0A939F954_9ACTN|nr:GNAT family N-acetyltransferase [Streptomyces beijiangensis]MBO0514228.1 GNAT family N-acetyltransferase [Streptomyces beijiangensis]
MDGEQISVTLHTPGLLLRPWEDGDLGALVEAYRDPAHVRWLDSKVTDEAGGRQWLDAQQAGWESGKLFTFAVVGAGDGKLAGCVVLKRPDPAGTDGEVGYWTVGAARGRGIAPRSVEAIVEWAYDGLGLRRLELIHAIDNDASCRVAEKTGFSYAQTLAATPPWPNDAHLHIRHAPSR